MYSNRYVKLPIDKHTDKPTDRQTNTGYNITFFNEVMDTGNPRSSFRVSKVYYRNISVTGAREEATKRAGASTAM